MNGNSAFDEHLRLYDSGEGPDTEPAMRQRQTRRSIIVQWLLTATRRIAAKRAHGRLPDPPTPAELADQAIDAALGNLELRERGAELDSATIWSVRP